MTNPPCPPSVTLTGRRPKAFFDDFLRECALAPPPPGDYSLLMKFSAQPTGYIVTDASLTAGPVPTTAEMVREALAHVPVALSPIDRWEWLADFINRAAGQPNGPWCTCCDHPLPF